MRGVGVACCASFAQDMVEGGVVCCASFAQDMVEGAWSVVLASHRTWLRGRGLLC